MKSIGITVQTTLFTGFIYISILGLIKLIIFLKTIAGI